MGGYLAHRLIGSGAQRGIGKFAALWYLRNFPSSPSYVFNKVTLLRWNFAMENLFFCLLVQLNLVFGVAGLIWPDKLKPFFVLLMFPWPASYRAIRVHGFVAIGAYVVVLGKLLTVGH